MTMTARHIAREQVTVSNAVITLTAATITQRVLYADIQVQDYPVRVTFDGSTDPEASVTGTLWQPGSVHRVWSEVHLENLKFIREDASDALVVVNYYGQPG